MFVAKYLRLFFFGLLVALTLGACGGGGEGDGESATQPPVATLRSLEIYPTDPTVAMGSSMRFAVTGIYSDFSRRDLTDQVTWVSGDTSVSVFDSPNGRLVGKGPGSTQLTASFDGQSARTVLTVTGDRVVQLTVTPGAVTVVEGMQAPIKVTAHFADGRTQDITGDVEWTSPHPSVATASNGKVNGHSGGSLYLRVRCQSVSLACNLAEAQVLVIVDTPRVSSLAVSPATKNLALGTSHRLTATGSFTDGVTRDLTNQLAWFSTNSSVVSVSSDGEVKALAVGRAEIYVSNHQVNSPTAEVVVTPAELTSIQIDPGATSLPVGVTKQFTATGTFSDGTTQDVTSQATWTSSAAGVASVRNAAPQGLATAVSAGATNITAHLGAVSSPVASLSVTPAALTSLSISPVASAVAVFSTKQFQALGGFSDGSVQDVTASVTWSTTPSTVASISNVTGTAGLATGVKPGYTIVKATAGALTAYAQLNVDALVFSTPGAHTWTVPAGVTSIQVIAAGAGGAGSQTPSRGWRGGNGGVVTSTLAVLPGETLSLFVGGGGRRAIVSTGSYGGGGGGSTNVNAGTPNQIVAGGGGGAGAGSTHEGQGTGGDAGGNGVSVGYRLSSGGMPGWFGIGGAGSSGVLSGGRGWDGNGGPGGPGGCSHTCDVTPDGGIGSGDGRGGHAGFMGGGGGGGYGGGGGAGGSVLEGNAGGGGGASVGPAGTVYSVGTNGGAIGSNGGDGYIVINPL